MPKLESTPNSIGGLLGDNHYPSIHDDMMRDDTPFEGTETALPVESPIPNAASVPMTVITKLTE